MSRVSVACSSASASGPSTSNLRSADRSITATRSRHAQYSWCGPWLSKLLGSQKPLYSVTLVVSAPVRAANAVGLVSTGSESGVSR